MQEDVILNVSPLSYMRAPHLRGVAHAHSAPLFPTPLVIFRQQCLESILKGL